MRERERLQARQVAVMVAAQLTKTSVTAPHPLEGHTDPRSFLEGVDDSVNDAEATLRDFHDQREKQEHEDDESWRNEHGDGVDLDRRLDLGEED